MCGWLVVRKRQETLFHVVWRQQIADKSLLSFAERRKVWCNRANFR
jgi:hypothetical protein